MCDSWHNSNRVNKLFCHYTRQRFSKISSHEGNQSGRETPAKSDEFTDVKTDDIINFVVVTFPFSWWICVFETLTDKSAALSCPAHLLIISNQHTCPPRGPRHPRYKDPAAAAGLCWTVSCWCWCCIKLHRLFFLSGVPSQSLSASTWKVNHILPCIQLPQPTWQPAICSSSLPPTLPVKIKAAAPHSLNHVGVFSFILFAATVERSFLF